DGLVLCGCAYGWLGADRAAHRGGFLPIIPLSLFCPDQFYDSAVKPFPCSLTRSYLTPLRPVALSMAGGFSLRTDFPRFSDRQKPIGRRHDSACHHQFPARNLGGVERRVDLLVNHDCSAKGIDVGLCLPARERFRARNRLAVGATNGAVPRRHGLHAHKKPRRYRGAAWANQGPSASARIQISRIPS